MSLKRTVAIACLAFALGCSDSKFNDEAEELEYLTSISQPSVEQVYRKMELEEKKAEADRKTLAEIEDVRAAHEKAMEPIRKAKREAETKAALEEAKEREKGFTPGTPRAADHYRKVIADNPDSPEADVARARLKELAESQ
jgi:hypothetical protein